MKTIMSSADYHAISAISSSLLKCIHRKTVRHALTEEFVETPQMLLGRVAHSLLLEPEAFEDEFSVLPKIDRRTKEGKAIYKAFEDKSINKTIITQETYDKAKEITRSVLGHDIARAMLAGGEGEYSYIIEDEETGITRKCRPDYLNGEAVIDIKTTSDASYEGFAKQIGSLGYHLQAAFYLDVLNKSEDKKFSEFYFIAVENKAPYAVAVYKLDETHISAGRDAYKESEKRYLKYLKDVKDHGEEKALSRSGYPCRVVEIQVPYYFLDRIRVEEKA